MLCRNAFTQSALNFEASSVFHVLKACLKAGLVLEFTDIQCLDAHRKEQPTRCHSLINLLPGQGLPKSLSDNSIVLGARSQHPAAVPQIVPRYSSQEPPPVGASTLSPSQHPRDIRLQTSGNRPFTDLLTAQTPDDVNGEARCLFLAYCEEVAKSCSFTLWSLRTLVSNILEVQKEQDHVLCTCCKRRSWAGQLEGQALSALDLML